MLIELTVENIAIIERCQIVLGPGFTVLTGETGAGKSLLVDSIELALGERADTELVRAGASKANVSAVLDLSDRPECIDLCAQLGISLENGTLYIDREVFAEGRSQCRVGGKLTPVGGLRQLGRLLVDLHGQHDHQSLLDPASHVRFLDDWIGEPAYRLLQALTASFLEAQEARERLASLRAGLRDREHRLDLLKFQVDEIEGAAPRGGEMEELDAKLSKLKNAERLASAATAAMSSLRDGESNAADELRLSLQSLEEVLRFDTDLTAIVEQLRSALVQVEEGSHDLAAYVDGLDSDPNELERTAERVDLLRRLRRKYGEDESSVLSFLETAKHELALLLDAESSEEELAMKLGVAESELWAHASELSRLRRTRATDFAHLVAAQLRDLAMERAEFEVGFAERPPDSAGMDQVEFFFSANAGEPPRALSKIASGGEISRVMLAIKTAMAGRAGVPTLIFDEVDVGLGGKAAATVARKLEELAAHYQVIVISHLPQIAARATTHFRIEKVERDGRVATEVRRLNEEERVCEVARMLAGEHVTDSARANAREMLGIGSVHLFN